MWVSVTVVGVRYGYTFFLVGSVCFWWGSHEGKDGEALLSQELFETGYVFFFCGAAVFMLAVVIGHYVTSPLNCRGMVC